VVVQNVLFTQASTVSIVFPFRCGMQVFSRDLSEGMLEDGGSSGTILGG